jgi:hypothetical protein
MHHHASDKAAIHETKASERLFCDQSQNPSMQSLRPGRLIKMKSVITRIALVFGCHYQSIRAAHNVAHSIGSTYESIPENLLLTNVVVIHRHGV